MYGNISCCVTHDNDGLRVSLKEMCNDRKLLDQLQYILSEIYYDVQQWADNTW